MLPPTLHPTLFTQQRHNYQYSMDENLKLIDTNEHKRDLGMLSFKVFQMSRRSQLQVCVVYYRPSSTCTTVSRGLQEEISALSSTPFSLNRRFYRNRAKAEVFSAATKLDCAMYCTTQAVLCASCIIWHRTSSDAIGALRSAMMVGTKRKVANAD